MSGTSHPLFRIAIASLLLTGLAGSARAGEKADETAPPPARKVLVIARIREEAKRRALEEEARIELKKRSVETVLSADVMTEEDFASGKTDGCSGECLTTFIYAGFNYSPRKYLDLGLSIGFDDLAHGGSFAPAGFLAFRI